MTPFAYHRAETPADALRGIAAADRGTRLLAGGTTLYDLMKLDVERPARVVDINALRELGGIEAGGTGDLVFGSLTRMADAAVDRNVVARFPAISESLWKAASQQLRNMASLGGNLLQRTRCGYFRGGEPFACNKRVPGSGCAAIGGIDRGHAVLGGSTSCIAVYPGDFAIALTAFDARVDVMGPRGARTIPIAELHRRPGSTPHIETSLAPDELITRIVVPASPAGRASTYHKIRDRESYAFALASAAVGLEMEGDTVRDARIALGGLATVPWRAREAEASLVGRPLTRATAAEAGRLALAAARPGRHNAFRIELGRRTVVDALMIAGEKA
jgi:xanthine dehydrogenase YagS FAD-binding subunit